MGRGFFSLPSLLCFLDVKYVDRIDLYVRFFVVFFFLNLVKLYKKIVIDYILIVL